MDYFNARYMAAMLGRFGSPDPGNAGADLTNPQSWNGYAYVLGNPLAMVDITGLGCAAVGGPTAHTSGCAGNYGPQGGGVSIDGGSPIAVGTFGGGNPAGGESALQGISVTEATWLSDGSTSPQNTAAYWFASGASASISYYPQAGAWVLSPGGSQFSALSEGDPLGGSYGGALALVGQNVDAQNAFLARFAASSAATGAVGGLAQTALGTVNELAFGSTYGRAVWTGGMAREAIESGLSVLSQSPVGRFIPNLPAAIKGHAWAAASYLWAAGASGAVVPFINGWKSESYFVRYELPKLLSNSSVRFLPFF